jgi:phage shock protein PspC (stress-responsive transcriptional regulator)
MAKIDEQKEKVNTLRVYSIFFIIMIFSLIAYIFNTFKQTPFIENIFLFLVLGVLIIIYFLLTLSLVKETKKLKDL